MTFVLLTLAGIVAIALITVVAIVLAARRHGPAIAAAQRDLFTQTGLRHPELPTGTIDEQVAFVPRRGSALARRLETRYVKPLADGERLDFHAVVAMEGNTRVRRQHWERTLAAPPRVHLQIADRALSSTGKAVREAVTGAARTWHARYPGPIALGDPELDARFVVFATDAEVARRCVTGPALRGHLLACAEVDVATTPTSIRFDDPADRNLRDARGPREGLDPSPRIRASIPVHLRVEQILAAVRDAVV